MTTFADLGLGQKILDALEAVGYKEPTPIQAGAIPPALAGKDVLGIAQTGTGKTASFTLPLIEKLSKGRAKARMPRSLILSPTRELAAQIAENFDNYAKHTKLTKVLLIGGVAFGPQEEILNRGADVVIATPGRLLDQFERGKVLLNGVQVLVIDEADRMLDMGFIPDIERILKTLPARRQTLFFSATMPPEIQSLVDKFMKDPERVEVSRPATTATTITQLLARVSDKTPKTKREMLRKAIDRDGVKNGIIFCNRKRDVDVVARSLQKHGLSAAPIHGDLDQSVRTKTLDQFKSGELRFLVASDVAARGLDIPAVSHVFNYDIPHNSEDYVHRIGRTGRAGLEGEAVSIFAPGDEKLLAAVEKMIGRPIEPADFSEAKRAKSGPTSSQKTSAESKKPEKVDKTEAAPEKKADAQKTSRTSRPADTGKRDTKRGKGGRQKESGQKASVKGFGDDVPAFFDIF
ncbi:DEAD/DEAH box helicase [Hyphobacterium sp. HN65]|uniref:DEAD/DEAH box helicase n=1 Tax=Hyphobacterium lacteum TaxID=3116575 RepID=A0ABU7LLN8_9PROT|nr:DEAD/DEAH box helicase [Hyphobacterium sp. HN65]MEE2524840.1 DEAD/DEAH box helicase [Hyphobacterium sp. HN65]